MRIKKLLTSIVVVFIAFVVGATTTVNAQETKWVNDETNLVSQDILDGVTFINEELFPTYELQPQIGLEVLYNIPEGYSGIDEYRVARFNELGIGTSGKDSGILFIIALNDRKFAIETGYGVEPILRDIEAKQILNNMTDDMRRFSETGDPTHFNNALNLAIGTIAKTLERGDTGELFAEREAKLAQEEAEREEARKIVIGFMGTVLAIIVGGMGLAGVSTYKEEREEEKRKELLKREEEKRKELLKNELDKTLEDFEAYFNNRLLPFEQEYGFTEFKEYFQKDVLGKDVEYIRSLREDKLSTLNRYRVEDIESSLRHIRLNNPHLYYKNYLPDMKSFISNRPDKLVKDYVNELDIKFEEERVKAQQLNAIIEEEVNEYLREENDKYVNTLDAKESLLRALRVEMRTTENCIMNLQVKEVDKESRLSIMDDTYQKEVVKGYIKKHPEFRSNSFGHGSQEEFIDLAVSHDGLLGNKDIRNKVILGTILTTLLATYLRDKEQEHQRMIEQQERRRQEEQRKREEEERRRRRMASSSSYSSSSYSSSSSSSSRRSGGSSFGSGFGGGRSGGGGASGGW